MTMTPLNPAAGACPFPVGAVLQMTTGTDPNKIYPGTTWEAINGVFLLGSSSSYKLGGTGGAATHALTVDELPSHKHSVGAHKHTVPEHGHGFTQPTVNGGATTTGDGGGHAHAIKRNDANQWLYAASDEASGFGLTQTPAFSNRIVVQSSTNNGNNSFRAVSVANHKHSQVAHTHSVSGGKVSDKAAFDTNNSTAFDSGASGGGSAFSTLPPYKVVNVWERTA